MGRAQRNFTRTTRKKDVQKKKDGAPSKLNSRGKTYMILKDRGRGRGAKKAESAQEGKFIKFAIKRENTSITRQGERNCPRKKKPKP